MNTVSTTGVAVREQKFNGSIHNRKDELVAYRKTINTASSAMISAMQAKDYEAVDRWSKMIDDTQAKIYEIVNQEDDHTTQKVESYDKVVSTTVDSIDKAVGVGTKVINSIPHIDLVA